MVDLDELEAKARAAKDRCGDWLSVGLLHEHYGHPVVEDAAFVAACDPDTVLHLIEIARAGKELAAAGVMLGDAWVESAHSHACCLHQRDRDLDQRRQEAQERWDGALARWESLAHSPQEA